MPRPSAREKIVDAALVEFHRRGFAACSVEDITKAAGVPKGSFYNHFKTKQDLAVAAVQRYTEQSGWRSEPRPDRSALERLRDRFAAMRDIQQGYEFHRGCLIGNMGSEAADHSAVIRDQVDSSLAGWTDSIADSLREAQANGELDNGRDAERLARFILNGWQGALIRAKVVKNDGPFDDFFTLVFDDLLRLVPA